MTSLVQSLCEGLLVVASLALFYCLSQQYALAMFRDEPELSSCDNDIRLPGRKDSSSFSTQLRKGSTDSSPGSYESHLSEVCTEQYDNASYVAVCAFRERLLVTAPQSSFSSALARNKVSTISKEPGKSTGTLPQQIGF